MKMISGVGVALATPFNNDYSIDFEGLEKLIQHIKQGAVDYLVVSGTTGEAPVLSWKERLSLLEFVIERNPCNVPVMFGLGGNNTFELVEKSIQLKSYPLSAILSVSPCYSIPSGKGIIRHYQMLADASPHPIVLYNVPHRTASNLSAETTLALAKHPNIIGVKEASDEMRQCEKILREMPKDFTFLAGNDSSALKLLQAGAQGAISVVANAIPSSFSQMVHLCLKGKKQEAEAINEQIAPFYTLASQEGNPTSLKAGLEVLQICSRTVKPPLFDASDSLVETWGKTL